uniref:PLAC8 family protein n=1 Tax=Panagrellus redivivus TaxID=6233 RepID=A0A7E4VIQ3_PANRE
MYRNIDDNQWKYNYACALLIVSFNIGIIITCRVVLDTENDFDEPILTGVNRERLELFLLYFSLTFCFGCCCCFFCVGKCFEWIGSAYSNCFTCDLAEAWTQSMHRPAAEALRQQHEQIDAAQNRKHPYSSMQSKPASGPKRPNFLNLGKPIGIAPTSHGREFIV